MRHHPRVRIACAQLAAFDLADAARAHAAALDAIAAAGAAGAEVCLLPEGTYPAYVLGSVGAARAALADGPDPLATFGAAARDARLELVVGLVLDRPEGLLNAAVHFAPDGTVRGFAAKRFLWHFDHAWFVPGGAAPVHDRIATLVCADGRLPEIATDLVARGATLLLNSTAWVTPVAPPEGSNPQADFLWRVRALEHGVVAAAATKVGTEAATTIYSGGSQIVAADGTVVAMASSTEPELLVADVDVPTTPRRQVVPFTHDGAPRRPPLRGDVAHVVIVSDDELDAALTGHDARVVVGPRGVHRAGDVHVVELRDDAALDPGPPRLAALGGAEVLAWIARSVDTPFVEAVARTRALENRVFVAVWRPLDRGGPFLVHPSGRVMARTPAHVARFAVGAPCFLAEAATKEMAPGTDAWDGVVALGEA
ncbi:MAG TPA: nitrilase-related carbon-nitrogen hydrolase [Acidimicrobiia bacterium]|nr:nitrilase-related carbon-nitrogen hydrolase [Acidimicrobiia bacterium]